MKQFKLEDLFTEKQLHHIVKRYVKEENWQLVDSKIAPAAEGIAGFLGDHLKITLVVKVEEFVRKVHLFMKRMPFDNQPKSEFIEKNNFYKREMVVFQLFDQMTPVEGYPCYEKALLYNESVLIMPDLSVEGYRSRPSLELFDLPHLLVAINSIAKFHATTANYQTKKNVNGTYKFLDEYGDIVTEPVFKASPWLRTAAKLSANLIKIFSTKYKNLNPDIEEKIYHSFLKACDSMKEYENTINVINHKDLWTNNIMFRYENGVPVNAILVDFQCIRFAPPTFDLMGFLYLNTNRSFREKHETDLLHYYYASFIKSLDEVTKLKVKELGYDREDFLEWCERSRMFGMVLAICIFPYVLMDPMTAQQTFDDPATFEKYTTEDRTEPVAAHASKNPMYKERQVNTAEEYFERYVLRQP